MFKHKKKLNEINERLKKIEIEKQQLLSIKQLLDDQSPKIDISNVYIWSLCGINYVVRRDLKETTGYLAINNNIEVNCYELNLIDVFSEKNILKKLILPKCISEKEICIGNNVFSDPFGILNPICEVRRDLLVYADKKVPLYVLQQTYYELNDIDVVTIVEKNKSLSK